MAKAADGRQLGAQSLRRAHFEIEHAHTAADSDTKELRKRDSVRVILLDTAHMSIAYKEKRQRAPAARRVLHATRGTAPAVAAQSQYERARLASGPEHGAVRKKKSVCRSLTS